MADYHQKHNIPKPVEKHETAAWRSHTKVVQPESNVGIPCETQVRNAKEWVDTNEK